MSIVNNSRCYVPVCDYCGRELSPEYSKEDAITAMRYAKWRGVKDDTGRHDYCLACWDGMQREEKSS